MENKIKEQEQFLIGHSEKDLYKVWANSVVISLNQAQKLIKTFKKMKIREGKDCLIFEDTSFLVFREIGKQHEYRILKSKKKKDTSKREQGSPAIKDNGLEKGITYPFVKSKDPFIVVHKCSNCNIIYEDVDNLTGGFCNKCEEKN